MATGLMSRSQTSYNKLKTEHNYNDALLFQVNFLYSTFLYIKMEQMVVFNLHFIREIRMACGNQVIRTEAMHAVIYLIKHILC